LADLEAILKILESWGDKNLQPSFDRRLWICDRKVKECSV
jgi:hypothetical protein